MALLTANAGHGNKLFAVEMLGLFAARNPLGQLLGNHDQGQHGLDQKVDVSRGRSGQLAPVNRAQGFRHDFRQKQNQQGHDGGKQAKPGVAKDHCRLGARTDRARCVRHRVDGQYGGKRAV